jgi:hypothetical protein
VQFVCSRRYKRSVFDEMTGSKTRVLLFVTMLTEIARRRALRFQAETKQLVLHQHRPSLDN